MPIYICPKCQKEINEEYTLESLSNLSCSQCIAHYMQTKEIQHLLRKKQRQNPNLISINKESDTTRIFLPWKSRLLVVFSAIFLHVVGFIGLAAELQGANDHLPLQRQGGEVGILFSIGSILLALVCTYISLAGLLNKTIIELTKKEIRISCHPLPWPFHHMDIPISSIQQLYVQKYGQYKSRNMGKEEIVCRYKIMVVTHKNWDTLIIKGIDTYEEAITIERSIEEILGITDQFVASEMEENEES